MSFRLVPNSVTLDELERRNIASGQSRIEEGTHSFPFPHFSSLPSFPLSSRPSSLLPYFPLCPYLPLRSRASQLGGLGERRKTRSGVWAGPQLKSNFVHFSLKI